MNWSYTIIKATRHMSLKIDDWNGFNKGSVLACYLLFRYN